MCKPALQLFIQTMDKKQGCMTSVLLQLHGSKLDPLVYYAAKIDLVAVSLPLCLRAVAAAENVALVSHVTCSSAFLLHFTEI